MKADTCVGSKRITEIEETLLRRFKEHQEPSGSLCTDSTGEESKESSLVVLSPHEEVEIMQEDRSASSFKKGRCSFTNSENSVREKREINFEENHEILGFVGQEKDFLCDFVSESFGCEKTSEDFAKNFENFGLLVQKTDNCVVSSSSDAEEKQGDVEETVNDVKEEKDHVKAEVGFSGVEGFNNHEVSGDCKAFGVEMDSVIDEKKEDAERLLEAKKRQLLAELEAGSIFKDKIHLEKFACFDTNTGIIGHLKGVDEHVTRSLKIEVIDDTALIEPVPVPQTGNGSVKFAEGNVNKNGKETDGKKAKRPRRKGKNVTKISETSERQKDTQGCIAQHCGRKIGDQVERKYSREEMEALRFVKIVEQRKRWRDIYNGLGNAVVKEYDGVANSKHQKSIRFISDPQHCSGRKQESTGDVSSEYVKNELENLEEDESENVNVSDPACSYSIEGEDSCTVLEGEYNEEDDSDEDYGSIQKPAFLVEGEPEFDGGPPEDGFEYLRRVRWEAAHIPKVKVVKLDTSKVNEEQSVYMPQIPDIAQCPEHLMPSKQWEDAFLADFSKLRVILSCNEDSCPKISHKLQSISTVHDENTKPYQIAESTIIDEFSSLRTDENHGTSTQKVIEEPPVGIAEDGKILTSPNSISSIGHSSDNYPTLSAILAMDSITRVSILRKRISLAENMSALSKNDCVWLFALCAAVDMPLHADTCATLRSLLRKCASLRVVKSELDDEVVMLNILATISGRFFGQSER